MLVIIETKIFKIEKEITASKNAYFKALTKNGIPSELIFEFKKTGKMKFQNKIFEMVETKDD